MTAAGGGKREHLWAKRSILFGAPSRKQNRVPREGKAVKCAAFDWGRDFSLPPSRALRVPPPSKREEYEDCGYAANLNKNLYYFISIKTYI